MPSFAKLSLTAIGVLALGLGLWPGASSASSRPTSATSSSENAASRAELRKHGLVYGGLIRARGGPCKGLFVFPAAHGPPACSHGPDPSPAGIDVRRAPSLSELRTRAQVSRSKDTRAAACYTGGPAIQGIYAHASGTTDNYTALLPSLQAYAGAADSVYQGSAAEQGGSRQLRWVTDGSCGVSVVDVTVSNNALGSFTTMISELRQQGFTDPSRKYLIWMDGTNTYCGIGQYYVDTMPGQGNLNNGAVAMFARVDRPCWGLLGGPGRILSRLHESDTHARVSGERSAERDG